MKRTIIAASIAALPILLGVSAVRAEPPEARSNIDASKMAALRLTCAWPAERRSTFSAGTLRVMTGGSSGAAGSRTAQNVTPPAIAMRTAPG